jgi:hypothetical protein
MGALIQGMPLDSSGAILTDSSATTQPVSVVSLPLPAGAATAAGVSLLDTDLATINANLTNGNLKTSQSGTWTTNKVPADKSVTVTGAAGAAVTLTIPAVAAQFHYIVGIEIECYTTLARVGVATPILVTSTNLPGSNTWTFATAAAIGSTDTKYFSFTNPYKSSVVNTATTFVCPATTSVIWRVNVIYYSAA